jgi:transcription antitermination factor NusA-like protein
MTFLKKFGEAVLKGIAIVTGFAPMAQAMFPGQSSVIQTVSADLAQIANIIVQTEALGQAIGLSGMDKIKAVVGPVEQIVLQSSLMVGHKIENEALFKQACQEYAQATVDFLNSLHPDGVQSKSLAA